MPKEKDNKIPQVDLIERIPSDTIDLKKLADFCQFKYDQVMQDRTQWEQRRSEYFQDIDNFVNYYTVRDLPFEGAANIHIPVTLEKQRAVHARLYQALFGVKPPFWVEPQEPVDEKRLKSIYQLLKWAVSRFVNYYKGIYDEADGFLWNFASEGWAVMRMSWMRKIRKSLDVVEIPPSKKEIQDLRERLASNPNTNDVTDLPIKLKEQLKWLTIFDGPVLENIQNEDFLMPGKGGIQNCQWVAIKTELTAHDLNIGKNSGYFIPEAVDIALTYPDDIYASSGSYANEITALKGDNQGYDLNAASNRTVDSNLLGATFKLLECYCTFDIDGDGYDEELVVAYHPNSKQVIRWTYLDRITKTGRRPLYKSDFIIRPGRNYAVGLCELLHSLSVEVDAVHNQRVDFGTFQNLPFFFYRSLSTIPNQSVMIEPGKGIPLENPTEDVYFPAFRGGTQWGFNEENLLFQIINRVSAISDINLGLTPSNSEAVRSQGQMLALLNEGNAQLDIPLRRVQNMFSELYGDLHQMLVHKLPRNFQHVVIGEDNTVELEPTTNIAITQTFKDPRKELAAKVHFHIQANSTAGSRALMRANRIQLFQQLLNPINLQLGIVGPNEVYNMNRRLLEVSDEVDTKVLLRKPENVPNPLSLGDEIAHLQQGILPEIPMNDQHESKAQALAAWIQHQSTLDNIQLGNINANAMLLTELAISIHNKYAALMDQQRQNFQNVTGSPTPMLGAGGAVNQMPLEQ